MNNKDNYIPPQLTIVSFVIEKGFDASGGGPSNMKLQHDESNMENFGFRTGWSDESDGNSNTFWD